MSSVDSKDGAFQGDLGVALSLVFHPACRLFRWEKCLCRIFASLRHKMFLFFLSVSVGCWCFGKRLSRYFEVMSSVCKTPWKTSRMLSMARDRQLPQVCLRMIKDDLVFLQLSTSKDGLGMPGRVKNDQGLLGTTKNFSGLLNVTRSQLFKGSIALSIG